MTKPTRREFLENSLFAAAAAAMVGGNASRAARADEAAEADKQSTSPSERLRVAVVGVRGRGTEHVGKFTGRKDTEVVAICDVDGYFAYKNGLLAVENATGKRPAIYQDIRKLLEDKSIDVISIATPNHWHALAAIWAIQAGKDVYVEKPVSHNVSEGRRIVDAARNHKKICQTGTQSRSSVGTRELMQFIHSGGIGDVKLARGLCYKSRPSIGPKLDYFRPLVGSRLDYAVPESVNYDLWCGPAPVKPVTRRQFHYDWHWQWDYGNGDLGNQGIHQMDLARWGLQVSDLGQGVLSYGGRVGYEDSGETANTQVSIHDYGDKTLVFEVRGLPTEGYKGAHVGVVFHGSQGYAVMGSYEGGAVFDGDGNLVKKFDQGGDHFANFVKAVRSRDINDLHADIEQGHLSSALCHLANVSYRLGEMVPAGEVQKRLESGTCKDECVETFDRVKQHFVANKINPDSVRLQFGAALTIDGKAETFTGAGSDKANPMLTREYRKGFEVPASKDLV
ncbi:MAG: Gfo/Idh/MocA family oxidoreductase [Planctomycetaceae bacterium]|nr:Gfo/Idh/MocA family oxidoreductase [Planctomycetaceae bacterium]